MRGHRDGNEDAGTVTVMAIDQHDSNDVRFPRLSDPTAADPASPFDSNERAETNGERYTQVSSDPPTAIVRRESFRELPPGSVVGETYEIDARLGAGAMGEVYAARHVNLGKRVAIKVIRQRLSEDDAAIERFAMEARTLAQIQHPAIVAVEHVGELADGRAYFVMEFLRGESLFERLQRGRIPLSEALRVLDQMARGLDAAHGEGVTHRDLKPENTFLVHLPGEPPVVKLVDFGLAKLKRTDIDLRAERTQSGVAIGTPMYMSPEQARGTDVDHRTDIYALGCVAYELVLGVPPFAHAKTAPELYAAHLHESPPLPRSIWPEIPPQLDLALFALLAKDPAHRPTLTQFRAVIADTRAQAPSQRAATEFVGPRATKQQHRHLAIAVVVVLVALVGGITIGTTLSRRSTQAPAAVPTIVLPDAVPPTPHPLAVPAVESEIRPTTTPATTDLKPSPSQSPHVSRSRISPPLPKTKTDSSLTVPVDAVVDTIETQPPPPRAADKPPLKDKPVDRNQTINPFTKKRSKANL
jgi:serine/threonine protein kinase